MTLHQAAHLTLELPGFFLARSDASMRRWVRRHVTKESA